MPVYDLRELVCWQLCHTLKCEVLESTAAGPAARDFTYRDQIRTSSAGPPANVAEGFGRRRPAELARFLEYACASLHETLNHLVDGHDRGYLDDPLYWRLLNLNRAALKATTNLLRAKRQQAMAEKAARRRLPCRRP